MRIEVNALLEKSLSKGINIKSSSEDENGKPKFSTLPHSRVSMLNFTRKKSFPPMELNPLEEK